MHPGTFSADSPPSKHTALLLRLARRAAVKGDSRGVETQDSLKGQREEARRGGERATEVFTVTRELEGVEVREGERRRRRVAIDTERQKEEARRVLTHSLEGGRPLEIVLLV